MQPNMPPTVQHTRLRLVTVTACVVVSMLPAASVAAHGGHDSNGLTSGLNHPLLGIDHVLAMVAVGVLAVLTGRRVAMPIAFLSAMVLGGLAGLAGLALPAGELAIALSVVALGAAVVAAAAVRPALAIGLTALAGFAHGHAHGVEVPAAANPLLYVIGFVTATAALHIGGIMLGTVVQRRMAARAVLGTAVLGAGLGLVVGLI